MPPSTRTVTEADAETGTGATEGAETERTEPNRPEGGDARPAWRRLLTGWPAQAAASTLLLGLLSHLRYDYAAGDRDHLVLSPLGMRWANPDEFAGDWALANAPQPHWLFDVITWLGASTGTLSLIYLLYWIAGLAAFGVGTTLLARAWTPRATWVAIVAVTVVAALGPLYLLGSGVHLYATALPNGLGGCLLYLCAAALLVGRHRLAAVAGVATALAHVQHGVVALVLLLMTAAYGWLRSRRFDWFLIGSSVATVALVVFNLKLRPVAGDLKDFQQVCDLLIPYHCEATSWQWGDFYGGVAFVALSLLTIAYLPRGERFRWVIVVALPALGLIAAVFCDRLNVPVLGLAVQGLNVYRLAVELFQFAVWGVLVAALAKLSARQRWLALAVTLVLGWYALQSQYWGLDGDANWHSLPIDRVTSIPLHLLVGLCLVAAVVVRTVPDLAGRRSEGLAQVGVAAGVLGLLFAAVAGNQLRFDRFDPRFFPHPALAAWGEEVQRAVPPGKQLLVPPSAVLVRMATRRGVVVDCKLAPYGGEAWHEYRRRMEALGGFGECGAPGFRKVTGDQLASIARQYGSGYLVLRSDQPTDTTIAATLGGQGWTQVTGDRPGAPYRVFKAPWETQ